jgi:hypothetical protein
MKTFYLLLFSFLVTLSAAAQYKKLKPEDINKLSKMEGGLNSLGEIYALDSAQDKRQKAVYRAIVTLKEAMKIPNSYEYKFENLQYISVVESPDKKFKVYTIQMVLDNQNCRHFGIIQLNAPTLKVIPLYDYSDTFALYPTKVTTNKNWWGQTYFNIQARKVGKKTYYFMFGYDQNDLWSKKKIVEPMSFVDDTKVEFGAPLFEMDEDGKKKTLTRFILEYKKDAIVTINYKEEYKAIVFDHTHPQDEKLVGLYFGYIPDGTYEAFVWKKTKWEWVERFTINDNPSMDIAPVPSPQGPSVKDKK